MNKNLFQKMCDVMSFLNSGFVGFFCLFGWVFFFVCVCGSHDFMDKVFKPEHNHRQAFYDKDPV